MVSEDDVRRLALSPFALEAFTDVEADVRQSLARIQASPFVPHKDQVRGFVHDVQHGRLQEVGVAVGAGA